MKFHWGLAIILVAVAVNFLSCKKEAGLPELDVYGHAGTTIYAEKWVYPANTKESIIYALDVLDADGVEVDVQMTKDSVLVLYHDAYLDGLTKFSGCIANYNFSEIENAEVYNSKYKLTPLSSALEVCNLRNKKLFIDAKPYNYCAEQDVNHTTFNNAFNLLLADFSNQFKSRITFNTRNNDLLQAISDTLVQKSLETDKIDFGIEQINLGVANELALNYKFLTQVSAAQLIELGIDFSIFGVKTEQEIKDVLALQPKKIITDNIAYTKKNSN